MRIGVPKEIKNQEYRLGMVPGAVRERTKRGHEVWVEHCAGAGIGIDDEDYRAAGARIASTQQALFSAAELIVKVKEPQREEWKWLGPEHTLFAYLHLALDPDQTAALLASGATCIAYESVSDSRDGLPLLAPMSEVAGRLAIQAGARGLEKNTGVAGILPFVIAMSENGVITALREDPHLLDGLNTHRGKLTQWPVADAQDREYTPALDAIDR